MILLPHDNKILADTVLGKLKGDKHEVCEHKLCDFDNVTFSVAIPPDDKDTLIVSLNCPFWHEIESFGASDGAEEFYGKYLFSGDNNVDLKINLNEFKDNAEDFAESVGHMKSNVIGGIFRRYFDGMRSNSPIKGDLTVHLRSDTTMYLCPKDDRLVVIFGMEFPHRTDRVIAQVLLAEMQEAKRKVGGAPICNFSVKVPLELQNLGVKEATSSGFVSFAILRRHIDTKEKGRRTAEVVLGFRQYITYHIKCSKAFFHQRMRAQVFSMLQVLNRAKTEKAVTKKLFSGKTWKH